MGVEKIIIPGTTKEDSLRSIEISQKYDNIFSMVALHPSFSDSLKQLTF